MLLFKYSIISRSIIAFSFFILLASCGTNEKTSVSKEVKDILTSLSTKCGYSNNVSFESLAVLYVDGNCSLCSAYILDLLHNNHGKYERKMILLKDANTYNLQKNIPELFTNSKNPNICLVVADKSMNAGKLFELNRTVYFNKSDL